MNLLRRMLQTQGREVDQGEDLLDRDNSADKGSDSTDEMVNVLGTLGAENILANGGLRLVFTTPSLSVATARTCVSPAVAIASVSFPTAVIFTIASVVTPTTRVTRSSRGVVIGSSSPISINILSIKQAERDYEIASIHSEGELKMMIAELNRSNEMVAKYLSEYEQAKANLSQDEKVELINELLMYQRHLAQIKKYQAQQNKPATKTKRRNFYMSILRSNAESERLKRPGIQLDKESFKKLKTAKASGTEPTKEQQSEEPKELSEEELKKMMNTTEVTDEKAKEIWVELKRLYKPDYRDLLWALQMYMHDSLVWRVYDTSGVYHVLSFPLLEYISTVSISVPTADVYTAKKFATIEDFARLHKDKIFSESKTRVCYI
nr:hypothetical protein [Tanacetum cinerariifolium]